MTPLRLPILLALMLCGLAFGLPQQGRAEPAGRTALLSIPPALERRQISVVVTPDLTETKKLKDPALREARRLMFTGATLPKAQLRALADEGDGLAAQKYARALAGKMPPGPPSDIAYYGSLAVNSGRVWSLPQTIEAMRQLDPDKEPKEHKRIYSEMLYAHAWAGNTLALDAIIDLNGEGRLFGPMSEATRQKVLDQGRKNGDGRAALRFAVALLQKPKIGAKDKATARSYLKEAAAAQDFAVSTTATNLLALLDAPAPTTVTQ